MKGCTFLEQHSDWSAAMEVETTENHVLTAHLQTCPTCRELFDTWQNVEKAILEIEQEASANVPNEASRRRLVQRARLEAAVSERSTHRRALVPVFAAAAVLLLSLATVLFRSSRPPRAPVPPVVIGTVSIITEDGVKTDNLDTSTKELLVPQSARATVRMGSDALGLSGGTHLRVEPAGTKDTRLTLVFGTLSINAAHRRLGESLVIRSDNVQIRVVGTRFSVTHPKDGQTNVAVSEGLVEVIDSKGKTFELAAGRALSTGPNEATTLASIDTEALRTIEFLLSKPQEDSATSDLVELPAPTAADRPTDLPNEELPGHDGKPGDTDAGKPTSRRTDDGPSTWRRLILDGRVDEAETALSSHLKKHPKDAEAWSLLSDCYRKTQKWRSAAAALERVEASGTRADVLRAQFRAGVLFQEKLHDHPSAAEKLEAYVQDGTGSLIAEASVHLAVSYIALGRRSEARALLSRVVQRHSGTTAAWTAKKMLLDL